jgi:chaperonin GroES
MKELQPLQEYVLLEMTEMEEKTSGGIIIPDTAKEKPQYGKVIAMGNNIENPGIQVGDFVYFKKFSGSEVEYNGKNLLFIPYGDLLAKLVDTEKI